MIPCDTLKGQQETSLRDRKVVISTINEVIRKNKDNQDEVEGVLAVQMVRLHKLAREYFISKSIFYFWVTEENPGVGLRPLPPPSRMGLSKPGAKRNKRQKSN